MPCFVWNKRIYMRNTASVHTLSGVVLCLLLFGQLHLHIVTTVQIFTLQPGIYSIRKFGISID